MADTFGPVANGNGWELNTTATATTTTSPVYWASSATVSNITWNPSATTGTLYWSSENEVDRVPPALEHVHDWEELRLSAREDPVADVCGECGEFRYRE